MHAEKYLLILCLVPALCGCSTMKVQSNYDRSASFANLRTYQWMPGPHGHETDPRIDSPALKTLIQTAVDRELQLKGSRLVPSGHPDFLVNYHATMETREETVRQGDGPDMADTGGDFDLWAGFSAEDYERVFDEGVLVIEIVDPATSRPIWRGSAQAEVERAENPQERDKRMTRAVRAMLRGFPPKR